MLSPEGVNTRTLQPITTRKAMTMHELKFLAASVAMAFVLATSAAWAQGDAKAGEELMKSCAGCHKYEGPDAKNAFGPAL